MNRRNRRQRDQEDSKSAEEAEEVKGDDEEEAAPISDEDDGENLQENAERDYEQIEELDQYEKESADEEEHGMDEEARQRAEQELADRDRRRHRDERRGQVDVDDYLEEDDLEYQLRIEQQRRMLFKDEDETEEDIDEKRFLDAEMTKGKLSEWIKEDQTIKFIRSRFSKFLKSFQGEANYPIYSVAIREMCTSNKQSLEVSYEHLKNTNPTLAIWIAFEPLVIFPYLNLTAYHIACKNYPAYQKIFPEVFVKIKDMPLMDNIRDLRYIHLNKLIHVIGVITKRSVVYSQLKKIAFKCYRCGQVKGDFFVNNFNDVKQINLGQCTSCQSNGPFLIDKSLTVYRNYQVVTIQESPGEVPAGRIPRQKEVVLLGDNIDVARPGDEVELIGVYMNKYSLRLNVTHGFPVFSTTIEANYIRRIEDTDTNSKGDAELENEFKKMKKDPLLVKKLINSVAPNIYGHENIKMAVLLAMFGGVERTVEDTHRVRGDINVLIMGDPGTAKSQFLKSVQNAFYRCIYTTGKGASAVGLTASVKRDFATNEWVLEAGALVLADKGICLIDEFDKMNEKDRTSIHEAMEQQSISISKAGIVTTLRARCSVIAAANPIHGRYNPQISFRDNVDLTQPILSRFDILCVVKDDVDQQLDHDLSTFVINQHMKTHPTAKKYGVMNELLDERHQTAEKYDLHLVKRYIKHARDTCRPQMTGANTQMIKQFYMQLREESQHTGGISIAVRHIESLVRMSIAHAKMHLRSEVKKEDVDTAIRVMLQSFIQTQKHSTSKLIMKKFRQFV